MDSSFSQCLFSKKGSLNFRAKKSTLKCTDPILTILGGNMIFGVKIQMSHFANILMLLKKLGRSLCQTKSLHIFTPVPEVKEAFGWLSPDAFKAKYGFGQPDKDIGNKLVKTCRSGRRVESDQQPSTNGTYPRFLQIGVSAYHHKTLVFLRRTKCTKTIKDRGIS